jgi:hypothetical protein
MLAHTERADQRPRSRTAVRANRQPHTVRKYIGGGSLFLENAAVKMESQIAALS